MERRHDLDWVRTLAFGLLVLYHVGMYYVTWDWHVKSPAAGPALEPLMLLSSPWRLSLLFLVSGVATASILEHRRKGFVRMRSHRLLWPLLFGMLVVVPPQAYYEVVEKLPGGYHDGYLAFWGRYLAGDGSFCRDGDCLDLPTWNHLWFLAYLWAYSMLLWAALTFAAGTMRRTAEHLGRWFAGPAVLVVPALVLGLVRMLLVGRFESTHALVDDWYNHAQYLPVFLLGFWLARATEAWNAIERWRGWSLGVALCSYLALVAYFGHYDDANPPPDWLRMAQRLTWGANQWLSIAAILGFARHWIKGDSPALRYLAPAVYPVYILHQTVIVVLAHNAQRLALNPWIEGPLLVACTFALCLAGYELIRRVPVLRPLFGLKRRTDPRGTPGVGGAQAHAADARG
ncbi:acyltransferase family protein [Marilutibacter aestuarii]|uniref:Acyltransferase family protein n=1 Tax=Marilutibacter aestuarii TaxID=1706195 RepID=A0A507ZY18_9GAMM|nr:acyltransferase family protein [Lysobacter aestuarii]TQD42596.1 acyltransferase family protein [Lysobacter aestuarii]